MALISWEPTRDLQSIQQEMNRLFGTFFDTDTMTAANGAQRRWIPPMDLVEEGEHFTLRVDLPGVAQDAVNVELADNVLTVSGERHSEHEQSKGANHRIERSWGRFSRSLTLPEGIDPEAIAASYDKGVLEVRIPKPEVRKPRKVAISVAEAPPVIDAEPGKQGAA